MMKMTPSYGKRPRVKRMTTLSGQPLPGLLDQDGEDPPPPLLCPSQVAIHANAFATACPAQSLKILDSDSCV